LGYYQKFLSKTGFKPKDNEYKAGILYMIAQTMYRNKKFEDASNYLDQFKEVLEQMPQMQSNDLFNKYYLLSSAISFFTGKLSLALKNTKIINKWQEKNQNISSGLISSILITLVVGMSIIYTIGVVYMNISLGWTLEKTLTVAVLPFIPLDILKCILASLLSVSLKRVIKNF
jgi:ABC-type multidrug transport system fused ATPase/permease subunit